MTVNIGRHSNNSICEIIHVVFFISLFVSIDTSTERTSCGIVIRLVAAHSGGAPDAISYRNVRPQYISLYYSLLSGPDMFDRTSFSIFFISSVEKCIIILRFQISAG